MSRKCERRSLSGPVARSTPRLAAVGEASAPIMGNIRLRRTNVVTGKPRWNIGKARTEVLPRTSRRGHPGLAASGNASPHNGEYQLRLSHSGNQETASGFFCGDQDGATPNGSGTLRTPPGSRHPPRAFPPQLPTCAPPHRMTGLTAAPVAGHPGCRSGNRTGDRRAIRK